MTDSLIITLVIFGSFLIGITVACVAVRWGGYDPMSEDHIPPTFIVLFWPLGVVVGAFYLVLNREIIGTLLKKYMSKRDK